MTKMSCATLVAAGVSLIAPLAAHGGVIPDGGMDGPVSGASGFQSPWLAVGSSGEDVAKDPTAATGDACAALLDALAATPGFDFAQDGSAPVARSQVFAGMEGAPYLLTLWEGAFKSPATVPGPNAPSAGGGTLFSYSFTASGSSTVLDLINSSTRNPLTGLEVLK